MSQRRADIPLTGPGSSKTVPIVGDAAIATQTLGEGRFIPVLIIDTSDRPDIDDLVKVLKGPRPGDVTSQWGRRHWHKKTVALFLTFERPSKVLVILEFDVTEQGILIDSILTAKALFLQPGRKGDRLSTTFDSPRILVEVPARGWKAEWDKLWSKALAKKLKNMGLKRQVRARLLSHSTGLARHRVGWDVLRDIPVPVVDAKIQKRLGTLLKDSVETVRTAERTRVATTSELSGLLDLDNEWAVHRLRAAKPPK